MNKNNSKTTKIRAKIKYARSARYVQFQRKTNVGFVKNVVKAVGNIESAENVEERDQKKRLVDFVKNAVKVVTIIVLNVKNVSN